MKPEDQVIMLPDDDADAIKIMLYWMYHEVICLPKASLNENLESVYSTMIQVYMLGDKYHIRKLRNDAIDVLYELFRLLEYDLAVLIRTISYVYEHTPGKNSSLQKLLVATFKACCIFQPLTEYEKKLHRLCVKYPDFFIDCASSLFDAEVDANQEYLGDQLYQKRCKAFHEHEDGVKLPDCDDCRWSTETFEEFTGREI